MRNYKNIGGLFGSTGRKSIGLSDSDGDGVLNIFDCQPYNKNKQGVIDDIRNRFADNKAIREREKEINRKERMDRILAGKQAERDTRKKADEAYYQERSRVEIEKAKQRARQGPLGARIGQGILNFASNVNASQNRTPVKRYSASVKSKSRSKIKTKKRRSSGGRQRSYSDSLSDMIGY